MILTTTVFFLKFYPSNQSRVLDKVDLQPYWRAVLIRLATRLAIFLFLETAMNEYPNFGSPIVLTEVVTHLAPRIKFSELS